MVRQRQADLLLVAATVIAACGWIFLAKPSRGCRFSPSLGCASFLRRCCCCRFVAAFTSNCYRHQSAFRPANEGAEVHGGGERRAVVRRTAAVAASVSFSSSPPPQKTSVHETIASGGWQPRKVGPISSFIAQMPILRQAGGTYDVRQITAKRSEHYAHDPYP